MLAISILHLFGTQIQAWNLMTHEQLAEDFNEFDPKINHYNVLDEISNMGHGTFDHNTNRKTHQGNYTA